MINICKQQEINNILDDEFVKKVVDEIYVFGSSITDNCTDNSDIDLYIVMKPEYEELDNDLYCHLFSLVNSDLDIIFDHSVIEFSKQFEKNLSKKERVYAI